MYVAIRGVLELFVEYRPTYHLRQFERWKDGEAWHVVVGRCVVIIEWPPDGRLPLFVMELGCIQLRWA